MGIFNKKSSRLPDFFKDEPVLETTAYEEVLDFLTGLSDAEYEQVHKVANIYRNADKDACKALGIAKQPTSFIKPKPPEKTWLDDEPDFLEDEPKTKKVNKVK